MSIIKRTYKNTAAGSGEASGRIQKYFGMYIGTVKDNVDADKMGRLRVWVPEFGSDPKSESGWRLVNYCSPFAGATPPAQPGKDISDYENTQTAYGMWMVPPDLEVQVAIMFAGGNPGMGYWFGCIPQQFMNNMIPGTSSSGNYKHLDPSFPKGKNVPVAEYNKYTKESITDNISRPVATPQYKAIAKQGLINDPIRGTSTASARREAPSQVYGISTPGPKINPTDPNNQHRKGGSSFVMDDGEGTENITFKTRSGAKIRIDETNGHIYFINKSGTAWLELDNDGYVDVFAANDISLRAQNDFNIRADNNINIEAGNNINIKAAKDKMGDPGAGIGSAGSGSDSGGNITIQAMNNLDLSTESNVKINSKSNFDLVVGDTGKIFTTGDLNLKSSAGTFITSGTDTNILSSGNHNETATTINMNGPTAATPAEEAEAASVPVVSTNTNVLYDFTDDYMFDRKTEEVQSVVSRLATFEPCPIHKENKTRGS